MKMQAMSPTSRFFLFSLRKLLFNFYRKNHLVKPGYYRQKNMTGSRGDHTRTTVLSDIEPNREVFHLSLENSQ